MWLDRWRTERTDIILMVENVGESGGKQNPPPGKADTQQVSLIGKTHEGNRQFLGYN